MNYPTAGEDGVVAVEDATLKIASGLRGAAGLHVQQLVVFLVRKPEVVA